MRYFYNVGNKKFTNFFLAHKFGYTTKTFVDFKLPQTYIEKIQSVKAKELEQVDIKEIYKQKLIYFKKKYSKLRLHYSGGLDSYSILVFADQCNIDFDSIVLECPSMFDDPYVNQEFLPAIEYAIKYSQFEIVKPTLETYKIFENKNWYETINGSSQLGFRPTYDSIYLPTMPEMLNILGDDKPWIYISKDNNKYYWVITDVSFYQTMGFDHCAFYIDGDYPEVAVKQAIQSKKFLQKYLPETRGLWVPNKGFQNLRLKKLYLDYIGRVPALSKLMLTGEMGKKIPVWVSEKNQRAMQECKNIGRNDIVENYFASINHTKKHYGKIQNCLQFTKLGFSQQLRFGAVFEITNEGLIHVDDSVIKI